MIVMSAGPANTRSGNRTTTFSAFVTISLAFCLTLDAGQVANTKAPAWRAATYRGLTIGKSNRADMLRVLGNPVWSGPSADQAPPQPIIWNDYGQIQGDLSGHLAVEVDRRNNRIVSISISPEKMVKEDAIRHFGKDYLLMGYAFCKDQPDGIGVGIVYEKPNPTSGDLQYLEYRVRGISIHIDSRGTVSGIYFVSGPMGLASDRDCRKEIERLAKEPK